MYEERFYRKQVVSRFKTEIAFKESDLLISTDNKIDIEIAKCILKKYYKQIESYIENNSDFLTSLSPLNQDSQAPLIVKRMLKSSQVTGIGPFSSVAGAIAQYVGEEILSFCKEVIIENGGDIFLKINEDKILGVYPSQQIGESEIALRIKKREYSFGIASSSGVFGPSINFGRADIVTVIACDALYADGFATALSNNIKARKDIDKVLEIARKSSIIEGIFIVLSKIV